MYELNFMLTTQKDYTSQSALCVTVLNFKHKYRPQMVNIK